MGFPNDKLRSATSNAGTYNIHLFTKKCAFALTLPIDVCHLSVSGPVSMTVFLNVHKETFN